MTEVERATGLLTNSYGPAQAELVSGKGCYVWDDHGKQYLDFLSGIAVNALGHAHPAFVKAVSRQAATLAHVSNFFVTPPQLRLAERLLQLSSAGTAGRVFFSNSGAEANEAALKMARLHGNARGKKTVLALNGSFHGRTMGSLSLTSNPQYREPFAPLPGGVIHIDATEEALEAAPWDDVAAVFLEPVQGEIGVVPLADSFIRKARALSSDADALLIIDEVQTGIGRVGAWFGFEKAGVTPDIVTLAKGLGGGIPIGATIAFEGAAGLFYPGSHGTTFGGNPLSAAAAVAVLDTIENDGLVANANSAGAALEKAVLALGSPLVEGVRGRGLLLGIVLTSEVAPAIVIAARKNGLIVNAPRPNVVRLAPPLIVGESEMADFIERFGKTLAEVQTPAEVQTLAEVQTPA